MWLCPHFSGNDVTTAIMKMRDVEIYVVSAYCDITVGEVPVELNKLMLERDRPVIIGMDSNAHSTLWNCDVTNARGEMIENFIMQNDL